MRHQDDVSQPRNMFGPTLRMLEVDVAVSERATLTVRDQVRTRLLFAHTTPASQLTLDWAKQLAKGEA